MSIFYAVGLAFAIAASNLAAGAASRASNFTTVLFLASPSALVLALAAAIISPSHLDPSSVLWGVAAGIVGGAALPLAYHALAIGPIGVVAPVIASTTTVSLGIASFFTEGMPGFRVWGGLGLCLVAIVLLGQGPSSAGGPMAAPGAGPKPLSAVGWAILAGLGFAGFVFLISIAQRDGGGLWPLVAARIAVLALTAALPLLTGLPTRPRPGVALLAIAAGILDMIANLLLLAALATTSLITIAVLEATAPGIAAIGAAAFLRESLNIRQKAGIVLAMTGAALAALG